MRLPRVSRQVRYALVVAVALAIAYTSVTAPAGATTGWDVLGIRSDKWLHAAAYAMLAGTLAYARLPERGRGPARAFAVAFLVAVGYGLAIELLQAGLPYRSFALADLAANAVGSVTGLLPVVAVER